MDKNTLLAEQIGTHIPIRWGPVRGWCGGGRRFQPLRRFRPSQSNLLSSSTFFTFGDRALFSGAEKAWGYDGSTQGNQSEVVR